MTILGIETSCDECSVSLVKDGTEIIDVITASQIDTHSTYKGVVPEFASRAHVQSILVCYNRLRERNTHYNYHVDAIAVTTEPGLTGSLIVGSAFARALSFGLQVPLIPVNHILAHLYAAHIEYNIPYPHIGMVLSGGHTLVGVSYSPSRFELMGETTDDACGEVFDKIAAHLGFDYPGGPIVELHARSGNINAAQFPTARLHNKYDFSFSGLKSAVIHQRNTFWNNDFEQNRDNICAAFQHTVCVTIQKVLLEVIRATNISTVVIGGGVACNQTLRTYLHNHTPGAVYCPAPSLCTDNAIMIAGLAAHQYPQKQHPIDQRWEVRSRTSFPRYTG